MEEKKIYRACEIFDPVPYPCTLKEYYEGELNPYKHMPVDDDPPAGTDALVKAFAKLQSLDLSDETTAQIARRHCAFFIRIIRFKYAPHTARDWERVIQELDETGYIPDETRNEYIQAYYQYILAHPEIKRWDYLDQLKGGGAHVNLWLLGQTVAICPWVRETLADKES